MMDSNTEWYLAKNNKYKDVAGVNKDIRSPKCVRRVHCSNIPMDRHD